jgi:hypothetical protein
LNAAQNRQLASCKASGGIGMTYRNYLKCCP